jgi:hypothetical protein
VDDGVGAATLIFLDFRCPTATLLVGTSRPAIQRANQPLVAELFFRRTLPAVICTQPHIYIPVARLKPLECSGRPNSHHQPALDIAPARPPTRPNFQSRCNPELELVSAAVNKIYPPEQCVRG